VACERVDGSDEPVVDRRQRRGQGDRQIEMLREVTDHPADVLQPRLIDVAIHPVDALKLEDDMVGDNIDDAAGYIHHRLR
jgi:hypothetical protein